MFRHSLLAALLLVAALGSGRATAQCTSLGPICPLSTTRTPLQRCSLPPTLCSPLAVLWPLEVRGAAASAPALLVLSSGAFPGPAIPIPRPTACEFGCALSYLPVATIPRATNSAGVARMDVVLPCIPSAVGTSTYTWWAILDGARACTEFSDVLQVTWQ